MAHSDTIPATGFPFCRVSDGPVNAGVAATDETPAVDPVATGVAGCNGPARERPHQLDTNRFVVTS